MRYATTIPAHHVARAHVAARSKDGASAVLSVDGYEFRIDRDVATGAMDVFEPGTSATHYMSVTPPRTDPLVPETIALNSWGLVSSRLAAPFTSARAIYKHESELRGLVATILGMVDALGVFRSARAAS